MSVISMTEASLPPGFRFHPTDDELVLDYLYHKLTGGGVYGGGGGVYGGVAMFDVDLNKCEPWDLPDAACVGGRDWYFFSLHDRKYATGRRTNRATRSGYWKATGKDRAIVTRRRGNAGVGGEPAVVGMRKTLVFYQGRAPRGTKTEWVMHEFRMEGLAVADHPTSSSSSNLKEEDWVLCRVFYKSGTSTPRPASDEVTGALSSEVSSPPASVLPVDAIFGSYYEQDSGQYHRPATAALPMRSPSSYMDLLSSMLHGGSDGANTEEGYLVQQSAMSQTWNLF